MAASQNEFIQYVFVMQNRFRHRKVIVFSICFHSRRKSTRLLTLQANHYDYVNVFPIDFQYILIANRFATKVNAIANDCQDITDSNDFVFCNEANASSNEQAKCFAKVFPTLYCYFGIKPTRFGFLTT